MPRRVLVDARFVTTAPASSHARYLRALAREWAHHERDLEIILYAPGPLPAGLPSSRLVKWRVAPDILSRLGRRAEGGRLWLNSAFTLASIKLRPKCLFFPYPYVPRVLVAPAVVTLHDVCFRSHRAFFADAGQSLDRRAKRALAAADTVIAVSAATRCAVAAAYRMDSTRMQVVHHGISPEFEATPSVDDGLVASRYGLSGRYFLCVSTHEPRKNLELVARAFVGLVDAESDAPTHLVLVGRPSDYTTRVWNVLERSSEAAARTRVLADVSDRDLAALYRGAVAVLAPTRCEGFGFPVVEALACGTPVLASDLAVFREIANTAVSYLPTEDAEAWTAAMRAALDDASSARLAARAAAAAMRTRFSWAACAASTRAVIASLADGNRLSSN